jgi:hypothetical protein
MADKQLFSLPGAARELGVSTDLMRRQYRKGLISAAVLTPGRQPRFSHECIERIRRDGWPQQISADPTRSVVGKRIMNVQGFPACNESEGEPDCATDLFQSDEQLQDAKHSVPEPTEATHEYFPTWVTPDPKYSNGHEELIQARKLALDRVLYKIPLGTTDLESAKVHTLARNGIHELDEESDCETLFAVGLESAAPVLSAIELRLRKEKLRALGLQMLPWNVTDKDRGEAGRAIDKVLGHMDCNKSEVELCGEIEDAIETIMAGVRDRTETEIRLRQIRCLLPLVKMHMGTFLTELCDQGELDSDALSDWSWRQGLERDLEAYLKEELTGSTTTAAVLVLVEEFLIEQLEGTDDEG